MHIGGIEDETMKAMFAKRLGAYAPLYREEFGLLAEYAGGNIR